MKTAEIYDALDRECTLYFYFLEDREELGEFISEMKPPRNFDLNTIPIRQWFVYLMDYSGDYEHHQLILLSDFKEEKYELLLSTAEILNKIELIKKGSSLEVKNEVNKNE